MVDILSKKGREDKVPMSGRYLFLSGDLPVLYRKRFPYCLSMVGESEDLVLGNL